MKKKKNETSGDPSLCERTLIHTLDNNSYTPPLSALHSACLGSPSPLDEFSKTNVIGVELVDTPNTQTGSSSQDPSDDGTKDRELSGVEVVNNA